MKSETFFPALLLLPTLQLHGVLYTYFSFVLTFFTFAELLCPCTYLVVCCNVRRECRGTAKPPGFQGSTTFASCIPSPALPTAGLPLFHKRVGKGVTSLYEKIGLRLSYDGLFFYPVWTVQEGRIFPLQKTALLGTSSLPEISRIKSMNVVNF